MKYKIFFIGLNNETLILLSKSQNLKIIGVNYFEYFDDFTLNPLDQLFRFIYKSHFKKKHRKLCNSIFRIWHIFHALSSKIFRDNADYLFCILKNEIEIVDTEDIDVFSSFITRNSIDLLVINSWGIIPNEILNLPKFKTMNIHPSILPQYRGALPTLWSLKNHDKESALTYLILNESIDDGLIIGQHFFKIEESDDWLSIEKKLSILLKDTLVMDTMNYLNNSYLPVKLCREPSYTEYYNKYRKIDLENETSKDIYNKVWLYPFIEPLFYCYIIILNKKIYIKKIILNGKNYKSTKPGSTRLNFGSIHFFTKDGILKSRLFKDITFSDSFFIIFNKILMRI